MSKKLLEVSNANGIRKIKGLSMRIAYFLDVPKGLGGAGNLLLQQAVLMSKIHNVIVVVPIDETGVPNEEYVKRCRQNKINYIGMHYSTAYSFTMIDFAAALESAPIIEEFVQREEIEFFHSVQLNIAVEYVSRKLGIPHLMNIYQICEEEFLLSRADIYPHYHLCDSLLYSNLWKKGLGIQSKCIRPVAISDAIKCKTSCRDGNKIKILMMGNVCERKNQLAAIKAIEILMTVPKYKIELHIVGEDNNKYATTCKQYVEEHFLNAVVYFYGFVSNVIPLLEDSDCLLCTSVDESFPSSMVEALTYDLTIISTPVAGVPEVFKDKENSFISKDFSEDAIAESITECLEYYRNGMIRKIHENAAQIWKCNFERTFVRKEIDSYYKQILMEYKKDNSVDVYKELQKQINELENSLNNSKNENDSSIPRYFRHGLYYLSIQEKLSKGKIYIWGAGRLGQRAYWLLSTICPDLEIVAFIDSRREGFIGSVPITKLSTALKETDNSIFYSISFLEGRDEAVRLLEEKGMKLNRQIWIIP